MTMIIKKEDQFSCHLGVLVTNKYQVHCVIVSFGLYCLSLQMGDEQKTNNRLKRTTPFMKDLHNVFANVFFSDLQ